METVRFRPFAVAAIAALAAAVFSFPQHALAAPPVIGAANLSYDTDRKQFFVSGWACEEGVHTSIGVQVYVDRAATDNPPGAKVASGVANQASEPAVNQSCKDNGGMHRFKVMIPDTAFPGDQPRKIFVHGIRPVPNGENSALSGSGTLVQPARYTRTRGPFRPVAGTYTSSATFPRVFTTPQDLADLARRIGMANSYSAQRFKDLSAQVAHDLSSPNMWDATYSGCNAGIYQYAFSYEPQDGNAGKVRENLKLPASATAPAGAAIVASRLALYAALLKAGVKPAAGAPDPQKATALSKKIILAWSEHGFRDEHGAFRSEPKTFCADDGTPTKTGVGLPISRGVVYSVHAVDLLMYLGALNPTEANAATKLHEALFTLMRNSLDEEFSEELAICDHYNNQSANIVGALLAVARLLDERDKFVAVLNGGVASTPISLPWNALLNGAIYGQHDVSNACRPNTGPDGMTSRPFFETPTVAPGEIDDRFRNLDPQKGIGYPMFTLERFFDTAEIMRISGYDGYGYRGARDQSIESAITFYACYAKHAGFDKAVTAANSQACPDAPQYYGKVVNGVDRLVLTGGYRFPNNTALTELEPEARTAASSGTLALDTILFGRWRN